MVNKVDLLHRRFGHLHHNVFIHLLKNDQTINLSTSLINQSAQQICKACQMGKSHRLHFLVTKTKTSQVLELIHTDLWGPSPIISKDGYVYYISFVDDFSRYTWIYPLKLKSEVLKVFKLFRLQAEKQFQCPIKMMQSDWGESIEHLLIFWTKMEPCSDTHVPTHTHTPKWGSWEEI